MDILAARVKSSKPAPHTADWVGRAKIPRPSPADERERADARGRRLVLNAAKGA